MILQLIIAAQGDAYAPPTDLSSASFQSHHIGRNGIGHLMCGCN
jgi:hypothetical protein